MSEDKEQRINTAARKLQGMQHEDMSDEDVMEKFSVNWEESWAVKTKAVLHDAEKLEGGTGKITDRTPSQKIIEMERDWNNMDVNTRILPREEAARRARILAQKRKIKGF